MELGWLRRRTAACRLETELFVNIQPMFTLPAPIMIQSSMFLSGTLSFRTLGSTTFRPAITNVIGNSSRRRLLTSGLLLKELDVGLPLVQAGLDVGDSSTMSLTASFNDGEPVDIFNSLLHPVYFHRGTSLVLRSVVRNAVVAYFLLVSASTVVLPPSSWLPFMEFTRRVCLRQAASLKIRV